MRIFIYFVIGAVLFGLILKISIDGTKKMANFLMIYDNPNIPKHSRKSMLLSLIPYFIILFALTELSSLNTIMFFVIMPAWLFTFYFTSHYIKLWKYHGYSALLLIFMSLIVLGISFGVSPLVREGAAIIAFKIRAEFF